MIKINIKKSFLNIFKYSFLIICCIVIILPLLTVFFGSFKTYEEFNTTSGISVPIDFSMENYKRAFVEGNMLRGFFNTFILVLFGTVGSTIIGSMVAFILSRFDFKFKKTIIFSYLLVSIIPMEVAQVSTFKIVNSMGLYNTRLSAIVLYLGADVIMIYIYLQMMQKIPKEIDKAIILEGGGFFCIYKKVIFPLLKPATATVCMLKTISIYNDFYIPFLYMPGENLNTVSTTLFNFIGPAKIEWNVICAAVVISMIPMIIFFVFIQKHIYSGIINGSLKG